MTETAATPDTESGESSTITDFGIDTTAMSTSEAVRDYLARLRAGELGSLPALLGLGVLVVVFAASSDFFLSLNNIANLLAQGAGQTIIAMGIVFVLLVGEIDLSAGTASGVAAAVMALHFVEGGNLLGGMGVINFAVFLGVLGLATLLAVLLRIWVGAALTIVAIVIVAGGFVANPWVEMLLALCVGTAIGCITGFLVSKIGMPSFVVTLALFLAWTGVILEVIGGRGVLGFRSSEVLYGVANSNLSTLGSWLLFVVGAGGFAAVTLGRHFSRLRGGGGGAPPPPRVGHVVEGGAAVMALHFVEGGNLLGGMGVINFAVFLGVLGLATLLAVLLRIWVGAALTIVAIVIVAGGFVANPWVEMLLALCVGTAIGCITGFLVSKIGMPSFVVTLALFLAWTGVILEIIGGRGVLGFRSSEVLYGVANSNLSTLGSWLLLVVGAGGFAAVTLGRHFSRLRRGLVAQPTPLVMAKVLVVAALGAAATGALTVDRSPNPQVVITGVPYVVPIILALLTVGTYVLNRTQYGRHIYAVGGNKEAARRAGINVAKIKASVFVVCSSTAALGAIVYTSKVGSVDPQAGGLNTLLFAVGAAVIGGTSLFGGRGRVFDAVIGGTVLAVINNGLGLLGQPASVVSIITGLVLLLAATVDALSRKRAAAAPR